MDHLPDRGRDDEDERGVSPLPLSQLPDADEKGSQTSQREGNVRCKNKMLEEENGDSRELNGHERHMRRPEKRQRVDSGDLDEEGVTGGSSARELMVNQLIEVREAPGVSPREGNVRCKNKMLEEENGDSRELNGHERHMRRPEKRQRVDSGDLDEEGVTGGSSARELMVNQLIEVREAPGVRNPAEDATEGPIEEQKLVLGPEELPLQRRHRGLGALFQQLGYVPDVQPIHDIKTRVKNLAARRLAQGLDRTLRQLPLGVIQDILLKLQGPSISHVMASSYIFLRAGVGPCDCDAFRANYNFFGIIMQPHNSSPSVAVLDRDQYHPSELVGLMLGKFVALRFKLHQWFKVIDSRGGFLLVLRDPTVRRLAILTPLNSVSIRRLPEVPHEAHEVFIGAALVPVEISSFAVIRISRVASGITLREFRSNTGVWLQTNLQSPLVLSALPVSRIVLQQYLFLASTDDEGAAPEP